MKLNFFKDDTRYKYVHILFHDEIKFSVNLVTFIYDEKCAFDFNQHCFVTPHLKVFHALDGYPNVYYYNLDNPISAQVINYVAKYCDWIFLHNICSLWEVIKIHPQNRKKIIWRSWGGNRLKFYLQEKKYVKNFVKKSIQKYVNYCVRQFAAIGGCNLTDEIELESFIGDKVFYEMPYISKLECENFKMLDAVQVANKTENLNVMIGHSAYDDDHHFTILEKLKKYCDEEFHIYIIASYGNKEYLNSLKKYIYGSVLENKISIVEKFLSYGEYLKLLKTMDIVFLDAEYSYALGNIQILLYFGKTIFLNENGTIKKAFDQLNIPCRTSTELDNMTFEQFSELLAYNNSVCEPLLPHSYEYNVNQWQALLSDLERFNGGRKKNEH